MENETTGEGSIVDKERRKFKRFDAYMNVKFKGEEGKEAVGMCLTSDLSRDGMKVTTSCGLKKGALMDIVIDIPDDPQPIRTTSEIMWVRNENEAEHEVGIRFLMMDSIDKFRMLDYAYNNWLESKIDDYDDPEDMLEG